jgi:superfamily II DNA helicase RecQ
MYECLPYSTDWEFTNCMEDFLKGLYGKDATWRVPEQRDAVEALLKLESDVIVALGAGVGKTAVAILPSMVEDGYTVITVGLKSLMDDWKYRLTKLNVPHEVYTGQGDLVGTTNLILVTVNRARQETWKTRLNKLQERRPVLRVVVDEGHQFFTDVDFRKTAFSHAFGLRSVSCQLVVMSASLPPPSIPYICESFGLCNPAIFRSPAVSRAISFRINSKPTIATRLQALQTFVYRCRMQHILGLEDRILVFVSYMDDGHHAAKELKCGFYHGSKGKEALTDQDRSQLLDNWRNTAQDGGNMYLVATPSLSSGFDYAHVRIVFFLNLPSTMVLFYQQAHRAGRDGKDAICMVLDSKLPAQKLGEMDKLGGAEAMVVLDRTVEGKKVCIRFQVSQVLDSLGKTCDELGDGYAKCDRCLDCKCYSL